jgi:hypothetical protein
MIGRLSFICVLLLLSLHVLAQPPSTVSGASASASYEDLIAKLKAGDKKVDFRSVRLAYAESKDALASGSSHLTRQAMNTALHNRRFDETIRIAADILKIVYISPDTHASLSTAYRELGDTARSDFHKTVYLGLVNSIIEVGDGKSPQTAYHVVTTEEEYAVMRAFGLSVWGQELINRDDRWFEILSATNTKTNETAKVYFNIDIPRKVLARTGNAKP